MNSNNSSETAFFPAVRKQKVELYLVLFQKKKENIWYIKKTMFGMNNID